MKLRNTILKLLILLVPFYFIRFNVGPIPTTLLEIAIYGAAVLFLFYKLFDLKDKKTLILAGGVFVLAGLVSAIVSPDKVSGLGLWKAYFFDGYLVFLMFLSALKNKKDFTDFVIYCGALTSALALLLFISGAKTIDGRLYDLDRLSANYLAMFLAPILVLSLYQTIKKKTIFHILASALIVVAIYLTDSRGALVALAGALILFLYYFLAKSRKTLARVLLVILLAGFFIGGYLIFKPDWSDHSRKATSSNVRYYIWQTSFEIIGQKPILGVGLSNYQNYFSTLTRDRVNYPEYISPVALTAHSLFIQLLATSGAVGLLAFLYLLFSSRFYFSKNLPIVLALFSILFYALVDTPFFRNDLAAIFWILLALSVNPVRNGDCFTINTGESKSPPSGTAPDHRKKSESLSNGVNYKQKNA
ncbi:MAG: O-antigen ligase family protein [bacterium]